MGTLESIPWDQLLENTDPNTESGLKQLSTRLDIVRLRAEGIETSEIAKMLNVSKSTVNNALKYAAREYLLAEGAAEIRAIESARMKKLARRVMPWVDPDSDQTIGEGENAIKVTDLPPDPKMLAEARNISKAILDIHGASEPKRISVDIHDNSEAQEAIEERLSRLERIRELADQMARAGVGSGDLSDDDIVEAEIVEDNDAK